MTPDIPEAGTPQTVLFATVRFRLNKMPFEPFRIVTTSGHAYNVPTADHAGVTPIARMIHIAHDDGSLTDIHALHVSAIEPLRKRKRAASWGRNARYHPPVRGGAAPKHRGRDAVESAPRDGACFL